VVDWGDGTPVQNYNTFGFYHIYEYNGIYQVKISGSFIGFDLDSSSRDKLLSVDQWGNVGFVSLERMFWGCTQLSSLPDGAITGAENVTSIVECFAFCDSLSSIPKGIFDKMIKLENVSGAFWETPIESVPENLFTVNVNITNFRSTFSVTGNTVSFTLPTSMFNYEALQAKQPDMTSCFSSSPGTMKGTAYPLWNYINYSSTFSNGCYRGNTALTNYDDIPDDWK
jgi:hypothetical protein